MKDARTNPFRTAACTGCDGKIIEPRVGNGKKGEGQWIHLELPPQSHPAVPVRPQPVNKAVHNA